MKTTYKTLLLFCLCTFFGCNSKSNHSPTTPTVNKIGCSPYFHFDKLEHYFLDIAEDKLWNTEQKKIKTEKEKKQLELLIQYVPGKLTDTSILKDIEKLDFIKTEISSNKFDQFNDIFCERQHKENNTSICAPVYRDILLFKKGNKIIGIAKLCFTCHQFIIIGTSLSTEEFGQSGDFEKLYKLLH